ncbi:uncharacterized protein LOC135392360 [Ornithodoros turicata]|uniref:uncharacterized protein LOC135392360 n=1 Tax=Ornithodoros turicata TaxID=34597 RepID=UPI003139DAE7
MYPFKLHRIHALSENDCRRRKQFCLEELERIQQNPTHLPFLVFTDKQCSTLTAELTLKTVDTGTVRAVNYLDMLNELFLPELEELHMQREVCTFMHDGVPPHWAVSVRSWLNDMFPGRSDRDSDRTLTWTEPARQAFRGIKTSLSNATLLHHPKHEAQTVLVVDASAVAVGAVLQQKIDDVWCPIPFFSKALRSAEVKYSTFGRELLAAHLAVRHFRFFLEGRKFTLLTDHKPLTFAFRSASTRYSPRETRHLAFLSEFCTNIVHVKGSDNSPADALSRIDAIHGTTCSSEDIAREQEADVELQSLLQSSSSLCFEDFEIPGSSLRIACDTSPGRQRPFVPLSLRRTVFESLHRLSHPGIRASQKLVTERFVWPKMHDPGPGLLPVLLARPPLKSFATPQLP